MGFFDFKRKKAVGERSVVANENYESEDYEREDSWRDEPEEGYEEVYEDEYDADIADANYYEPEYVSETEEEEEAVLHSDYYEAPEVGSAEAEILNVVSGIEEEETDFFAKSKKAAASKKAKQQRKDLSGKTEDGKMQKADIGRTSMENLESIQNSNDEVLTAVEDASYRIQEGLDENMTVLERSIGANAEKILEAIKNTTVGGVNDLDDMSRLQFFKNVKISLLSFVLSIFAGFMIISSLLSLIKLMNMDGPIELILIDYIFVGLFSVGSILLSLYQKRCFSKCKSLRDYLVSKSQVDSIARCALWIVIGVLIVAFFVMLAISIGIIVKYS